MESFDRSVSDMQPQSKKLRVSTSITIYHTQEDTTVEVDLREVPEFLKCGEYYRSFQYCETEIPCTGDGKDHISNKSDSHSKISSIVVPSNCYKNSPMILNSANLHHLLSTLRFWLVDVLPDSVIAYALNRDMGHSFSVVAKPFMTDLPKLKVLLSLRHCVDRSSRLLRAMEASSCEEIVEYLFEHCKYESTLNSWVTRTAAEVGSIKYLQYAHEHGYPWTTTTCSYAAANGHLHCLKYAHEHGCPWDASTNISAAGGGHLDCMKYADEHGCPFDVPATAEKCTLTAAYHGHLNCLQYAHEHGASLLPEVNVNAAVAAIEGGHINCLQYALNNGCSCDNNTIHNAIRSEKLDCVVYLREQGCPWNTNLCAYAAEIGLLDWLQYLHEQDCPWDEQTTLEAAFGRECGNTGIVSRSTRL